MSSEVETILNEIRERVLAEERAAAPSLEVAPQPSWPNGSSAAVVVRSEALERVASELTVAARAWNKLPPVCSNRRGLMARMELWIKKSFKSLTHWFTWEQVNFNAAAHHALTDLSAVATAQSRELAVFREDAQRALNDLTAAATAQGRDMAAFREDANGRNQKLESIEREVLSLRSLWESQVQELRLLNSTQTTNRADVQARLTETEAALARFSNSISGLTQAIAETTNDLREEQRVCFKQLSLEASEASILEDRGRRALEARLERLEKRNSE